VTRIDAHGHLIPEPYRAALSRRGLEPAYPLPPATPEDFRQVMDRHAIDAAVVSISPPGVWFGDPGLAAELARLVNEELAAAVRAEPARFAGLATLPLPDVDAALAEIAYAFDELGLDGVAMFSNVAGTYLGDPAWDPVFDELDRRGAYVFVHPIEPEAPSPLPTVPGWVAEFPFDTTRAAVNLIYSGTLERCPSLRVQLAHLGGTAPFIAHRIAEWAGRDPSRAEAAPAGALTYLRRLYYDTGLANNAVALAAVRELAGIRQVAFGTDWPYAVLPDGADPAPGLGDLDPAAREAVDGGNVAALVPRLAGALAG
jgi:predicted TIM-barrel fold metal-dependent hydrolase